MAQNGTLPTSSGETTLSRLESHLWESANILRGPVDAADFKTNIDLTNEKSSEFNTPRPVVRLTEAHCLYVGPNERWRGGK